MAQALAKWYCVGSEIIRIDLPAEIDWFKQLGQGNLLGFPICTLIWIAVMVILQIVIKKTTFGRQMLLTGANKKSAFLAGINVNRVKVIAYTVAGFCCGIAAVIYAARFTSASDGAGVGGDFNGAVCSIIGGNAHYGGHGGMVQVFIGTVTFGLISNILQLFGLSTAVLYIVQARSCCWRSTWISEKEGERYDAGKESIQGLPHPAAGGADLRDHVAGQKTFSPRTISSPLRIPSPATASWRWASRSSCWSASSIFRSVRSSRFRPVSL